MSRWMWWVAGMVLSVHGAELRFEAEEWSEPASAWLPDKDGADHWNLWSRDKDAAAKWSGGKVLRGPDTKADRAGPEEGAPPLHTRVTGLSNGLYDVALQVGRTVGVSLDGRTWMRYTGGLLAENLAVSNGTFEVWVDDRYADARSPGTPYYDFVSLTRVPKPVPKPRVEGLARPRVAERLDRGLVALPIEGGVYAGWRLLRSDPPDVAFNVYRRAGDGEAARVNAEPIRATTDFVDAGAPRGESLAYTVRPVTDGREGADEGSARATPVDGATAYREIKLAGDPTFAKCAVADLDGDGAYDYVVKRPGASIDPASSYWKPSPSSYVIEAYRSDGRLLWRHDLGWSIEQGIWYSPYLVYDFDGDGRAEVAAKTGEGDPRGPDGRVRSGPEWVTVWDGATGREIARAPWPDRSGFGEDERGYNYASRNQLAVAYLDGRTPFLILLRGTYTIMKVEAYELAEGKLRRAWGFTDDEGGRRYRSQGGHFTHAADIDGDGRDEVLLGSSVIDDNGSPLWSTGLGHPDMFHVGDLDPARPGLEVFYTIEPAKPRNGICMADALTGRMLWGLDQPTKHVHSYGLCADIDPTRPGSEGYGADSAAHKPTGDRWLFSADGRLITRDWDIGFGKRAVYWDADLQREVVMGSRIVDYEGGAHDVRIEGREPVLVADVFGDWREELIVTAPGALRVYTTTLPAMDRRVTLMQDPVYRLDVAMGSMGYTLVPTPSYDLEASAPNLNLTALAAGPGEVRVVAAAARGAPLAGEIRLSAAPAEISPSAWKLDLKPGERSVRTCRVRLPPDARGVTVCAELVRPEGVLRGRVEVTR